MAGDSRKAQDTGGATRTGGAGVTYGFTPPTTAQVCIAPAGTRTEPAPMPMPEQVQQQDEKTNVLIVGSGAREHALLYALKRSDMAGTIYVAPGNGGTSCHNVPIKATEIDDLSEFAMDAKCVTVVGPEMPLALGIVDHFTERGMPIFGPTQFQAKIEWSKAYSKVFMRDHGIPTPNFMVFTKSGPAIEYAGDRGWDVVVKADGLADGKGAVMCSTEYEVRNAVTGILDKRVFGGAGNFVLVEDKMRGPEISVFALCDGERAHYLGTAADYKRLLEGDKGPNTGGMGAYSPVPMARGIVESIMRDMMDPVVKSTGFKGFLYGGVMLTYQGPMMLEFNARMGDPEAQVILPRLNFDLLAEMVSVARGGRISANISEGTSGFACCVNMCSKGYPFSHSKNPAWDISGPYDVSNSDIIVFHGGTKREYGRLFAVGGRVLSVVGQSPRSLGEAAGIAYLTVGRIDFEGEHHRPDIGRGRKAKV